MKILRYLGVVVVVVFIVAIMVALSIAFVIQYHPQTKNVHKIMEHGMMQNVSLHLPKLQLSSSSFFFFLKQILKGRFPMAFESPQSSG